MHDLVVDRSRPGVLYGATMCGLFTGHDNALAWLPTTNGLPEVTCWRPPLGCVTCDGPWAITSSPRHSKHLWVLTWDGTYHSLDAGRSWSAYPSDGLPEYVGWWKQIVIDPSGERL